MNDQKMPEDELRREIRGYLDKRIILVLWTIANKKKKINLIKIKETY